MNKRVDWVDYAKGLTILLVVIMHSTFNVELQLGQEGWMHNAYAFATPFRMPVFFAVAGLFAASAIGKDWRTFLDGKFLHYAYFYVIWMTIQFVFKAPFFIQDFGASGTLSYYFLSFVQPFGPLWFIYLLPFYFLALRLSQDAPILAQLAFAIALKFMLSHTGVYVIDFFSKYYVFFLIGHFGKDLWFRLAQAAQANKPVALIGFIGWSLVNGVLVYSGWSALTPVAIVMGILGFIAVVDLMAIIPRRGIGEFLRYCGQRSLPIYLGFFLPMGIARLAVPKICPECSVGMVAFIVSTVAIVGAVAMYEAIIRFQFGQLLYARPDWARLPTEKTNLAPAE